MSTAHARRIGRPDQQASEELVRHIVATAATLFVEQGYAATSLEQIAAAAGSGKQTLYRRFGSKQDLFAAVIVEKSRELVALAAEVEIAQPDPVAALKATCRLIFDFVLQPESISLQRVMVGELSRFPELAEMVLEDCKRPFEDLLERLVEAAARSGRIKVDDVKRTHQLMISLFTGWPSREALFGKSAFADAAERDAYFEAGWSLFLRGVG